MRRVQTIRSSAVILLLLSSWVSAFGQNISRSRVSRPSEGAASTRVGRVGGALTRGEDVARSTNSPTNTNSTNFALPGFDPDFIGRTGPAMIPQAFLPAQSGSRSRLQELSPYSRMGVAQRGEIAQISGLTRSNALHVPFEGIRPAPSFSLSPASYYARPPIDTPFHRYFGLREEDDAKTGAYQFESRAAFLEAQNRGFVENSLREAQMLFKDATSPDSIGRTEKLSRVVGLLSAARDGDRSAATPCLLLAQVHLEKNELMLCSRMLFEAVRRNPNIFVEKFDMASYYGDAAGAAALGRRLLRIGDEAPAPETYAVQAYGAWLMQDRPRMRDSVDKLLKVLLKSSNPPARVFAYAMNATLLEEVAGQ